MSLRHFHVVLVAGAVSCVTAPAIAGAGLRYEGRQIPVPAEGWLLGKKINNQGQIGAERFTIFNSGWPLATRLDADMLVHELIAPPFDFFRVDQISGEGHVIGVSAVVPSQDGPVPLTMVRHTPNVGLEVIGNLGGLWGSIRAANHSGSFVGSWSTAPLGGSSAFVYTDAGGLRNLAAGMPGVWGSEAFDINGAGVVVGWAASTQFNTQAVRWFDGQFELLGTLGGSSSQAAAINNAGVIVGWASDTADRTQAVRWAENGGIEALNLPPNQFSFAHFINETGAIAGGWMPMGAERTRAFYYVDGAAPVDIDLPAGMAFSGIEAFNDRGEMLISLFNIGIYELNTAVWSPREGLRLIKDLQITGLTWIPEAARDLNEAGQIVVVGDSSEESAILTPIFTGDSNCDGVTSPGDIAAFVQALTNPTAYHAAFPTCALLNSDINGDDAVTPADIGAFVSLLTGS